VPAVRSSPERRTAAGASGVMAATRRYEHSRDNLDRNAAYTVAAYLA
jgi:hypothetical protein